jgi:hypothetical protein
MFSMMSAADGSKPESTPKPSGKKGKGVTFGGAK